jgi:hypothetical protein
MIKQLSVIGVGLIGGSLALALKQAGYCQRIVGIGRHLQRLQAARHAGVIDFGTTDYAEGLADADMIFISVPLNAYVDTFQQIKGKFKAGTVITDAGSAKACVIEDAVKVFGKLPPNFVPGHPIAGTEKSGFEAAFPELFCKRRVVLTPAAETLDAAIKAVTAMWQVTGAVVESVDICPIYWLLAWSTASLGKTMSRRFSALRRGGFVILQGLRHRTPLYGAISAYVTVTPYCRRCGITAWIWTSWKQRLRTAMSSH